jgi:hypothetical protein
MSFLERVHHILQFDIPPLFDLLKSWLMKLFLKRPASLRLYHHVVITHFKWATVVQQKWMPTFYNPMESVPEVETSSQQVILFSKTSVSYTSTSGRRAAKRWSSVMYFLSVIPFLIDIFGKRNWF